MGAGIICNILYINLSFLNSKDVYKQVAVEKLRNELIYIKESISKGHPSVEYVGNYCMQAAERGLSELLNDNINFYSVERETDKRKNNIGFSGKTAYDRGEIFQQKGFVEKVHIFNKYTINQSKRELINKSKDYNEAEDNYRKVMYEIIELSDLNKKNLFEFFENDIKNKEMGYHVYYFTVTNGFHTLLLIIDNTNICNPTYSIWDQHAETTSFGKLEEIGEGLRKQTSWTFANTCLNRYRTGAIKYFDSTDTKLWKIKRK